VSEPGKELWGAIKERWLWGVIVLAVIVLAGIGAAHLIDDFIMLLASWLRTR